MFLPLQSVRRYKAEDCLAAGCTHLTGDYIAVSQLADMTNAMLLSPLLLLLLLWPPPSASQYAVNDDEGAEDTAPARPDYSRYFAAPDASGTLQAAPAEDNAGFVRPLDFSAIFSAAPSAVAAVPAFGLLDPAGAAASNSNSTVGFTSQQVRFPSLFDAAGSDAGFRPQDFLTAPTAAAASAPESRQPAPDVFSPSFAKLERDYNPRPKGYDSAIRAAASADSPTSPDSPPAPKPYTGYIAPPELVEVIGGGGASNYKSVVPEGRPRPYTGYRAAPGVSLDGGSPSAASPQSSGATLHPGRPYPGYRAAPDYLQTAPSDKEADYYGSKYQAQTPTAGKSSYPGTPNVGFNGKYLKPEKHLPVAARYQEASSSAVPKTSSEDIQASAAANPEDKKKNCKKVEKSITAEDVASGRFRRQAMTCYVCEDPATGGNYEECSYGSDQPQAEAYFVGTSKSHKNKPIEKSVRYRRQIPDHYERELDSFLKSDATSSSSYRFGPEAFEEGSHVAAATDTKGCKKTVKDSMTCYVCQDAKTGGSYEQCSYSTKPASNNYFVEKQSSFSRGSGQPEKSSSTSYDSRQDGSEKKESKRDRKDTKRVKDSSVLADFKDTKDQTGSASGPDSFLYGGPNEEFKYKSYDEYIRHLFPELEAGASESRSSSQPAEKKDLEEVLGEFARKDRSACKKVQRDKMTCYQCVDQKGVRNEECMFVAASQPQSKHLAYHQLQKFGSNPGKDSSGAASVNSERQPEATSTTTTNQPEATTVVTKSQRKNFKKASEATAAPARKLRLTRRSSDSPKPASSSAAAQEPAELSEADRSPDGLYTAETSLVFDPVLKVTLPKYMLDRSEHEDIFDEVMASGR